MRPWPLPKLEGFFYGLWVGLLLGVIFVASIVDWGALERLEAERNHWHGVAARATDAAEDAANLATTLADRAVMWQRTAEDRAEWCTR